MAENATQKFTLRNLDCPACAAKIEQGLRKLDGVKEARVDFASLTLHVDAGDLQKVVAEVGRIEPGVEVVPRHGATQAMTAGDRSAKTRSEAILLAVSLVLLAAQLWKGPWLRANGLGALELALVLAAYFMAGWNVFTGAWRNIRRGLVFDENILMIIATCGAFFIQAYAEALGVMIFFKVGEMLQDRALDRSRRSIRALLAAKPDYALVTRGRRVEKVPPETVAVGQTILVRPGDKVPLDGEVVEGRSQLDAAALTGESLPVKAAPGDQVMAGQINLSGALTVRVTRPFEESSMARIMDLVQNATANKARTERFITTFARYYTPAVVLAAAVVAAAPPILMAGQDFRTWLYRALVLLVISCPCALVISIPLGYFGGIGKASRMGILVKGSNFIDALAAARTVVFDKTGTLTRGVFRVNRIVPADGFSQHQLLEFAAAAEYRSNHPIAVSILEASRRQGCRPHTGRLKQHNQIAGQGVEVDYDGRHIMVGNDRLLHSRQIEHPRCSFDTTVVHVVVDGRYAGYISIGDRIKPDAAQAVQALRHLGVSHLSMLTGDNQCAAAYVAGSLKLDSFHADLLPEDKVAAFEKLRQNTVSGGRIVFVGDGINDAPVIAAADVGVAMGALGSDAAIEAADVVLMTDSPLKVAEAVGVARRTRRIVWQNITLAFTIKAFFIALGAAGIATMWEAVFADVGTALLALFNSMRILRD